MQHNPCFIYYLFWHLPVNLWEIVRRQNVPGYFDIFVMNHNSNLDELSYPCYHKVVPSSRTTPCKQLGLVTITMLRPVSNPVITDE
jgi:hypothetical protein